MKYTATKLSRALCSMVMVLVLATSIIALPALAASNGIYIATATPHYRHPTTGVIEDSGGKSSEVLGQSMTESATYNQALVEVDENGRTYVTVRLKLMDNIQNPSFSVDDSAVSASLMQEDYNNNTADYRMRVNSEYSVIRCSMYVVPMGRQVIFYITVSNLQSGSGDFITSITVNPNSQTTPAPAASSSPSSSPGTSEKPTTTANPKASATPAPSASAAVESDSPEATDDANGGLEEFDAEGNEVDTDKTEETTSSGGSAAVWIIVGVVVVLAAVAAWYFGSYKKKH